MKKIRNLSFLALCLRAVLLPMQAQAVATGAQLCEAAKLTASSKYSQCMLKADATFAKSDGSQAAIDKRDATYVKCSATLERSYELAEARYPLAPPDGCPTTGDYATVDDYLAQCTAEVADATGGDGPLPGPLTCGNGDIDGTEACDVGNLNGKTCIEQGFAGGTLRCAPGCTFDTSSCFATRWVDNGDGTVADNQTGLVWEKKTTAIGSGQNYDDPHDVDNLYTWGSDTAPWPHTAPYPPDGTVFKEFLAKLNGGLGANTCFAGHCDWRLPTIEELQSIVDLNAPGCQTAPYPPCIDAIFDPTAADSTWSWTTVHFDPAYVFIVNFSCPSTDCTFSSVKLEGSVGYVRAVRGGS